MSPKVQHLKNAPIKEALIDIQIKPVPGLSEQSLQQIKQALNADYPESRDIHKTQISFNPPDSSTERSQEHLGVALISEDKTQIFQARSNGFTFSRLKPYSSWEHMKREAQRLWEIYKEFFKPELVTRLAVRYINRLELRYPLDISEYLTAPPNRPKDTPDKISSFLTRNVVPISEFDATTIFTQAMEQVTKEKVVPIIIDIDVFTETKIDTTENFWEILDNFRDVKNRFFFGSITDKVIEEYK